MEHGAQWRRVLTLLSAALLVEVVTFSHLGAFVPIYLGRELNLSTTEVSWWTGLLSGLPLTIAFALAPFWGVLAARYGTKMILIRSQVFEFIVYLGLFFATDLSHMVVASLLLGFTYGNIAIMLAVQSAFTPTQRIGFAVSILWAMTPLGQSVGPLVGSFLIEAVGLRGLFALDAALVVIVASLLWFGVPEPPRVAHPGGVMSHLRLTFRQAWTLPAMRYTFLTMFFLMAAITAVQPYIPIFLSQYFEGEALTQAIGWVLGAAGLSAVIGTPILGWLGDRLGHPRIATVGLGVLALAHAALFVVAGPLALISLLLVRAIPQGGVMGSLNAGLAVLAPPSNRSALISLAPFPRNVGMFVGPMAAAAIAVWDLRALFLFGALLMLCALASGVALSRATTPTTQTESVTPAPQEV